MLDAIKPGTEDPPRTEEDDERHTVLGRFLPGRPSVGSRLRSATLGLIGGAFGTVVMTVFRMPIADSLPPTANFLAKFLGGDPEDYPVSSIVLHFAYGIGSGALIGPLIGERTDRSRAGIELRDIAYGLGYSLVLSLFGSRIVLDRMIGMDLDPDEALIFHVGHAVYGLALGAWMGSRQESPTDRSE